MDVVGIGTPYYDMVINVSKMPGLDGAAGANEAFYQGGRQGGDRNGRCRQIGEKRRHDGQGGRKPQRTVYHQ